MPIMMFSPVYFFFWTHFTKLCSRLHWLERLGFSLPSFPGCGQQKLCSFTRIFLKRTCLNLLNTNKWWEPTLPWLKWLNSGYFFQYRYPTPLMSPWAEAKDCSMLELCSLKMLISVILIFFAFNSKFAENNAYAFYAYCFLKELHHFFLL